MTESQPDVIEININSRYAIVFRRKLSDSEIKDIVETIKEFEKSGGKFLVINDSTVEFKEL